MATLTLPADGSLTTYDGDMSNLLTDSGALLYGEFTLSSGKTSSYYFDSKLLTLDPKGAAAVGAYFLDKLVGSGVVAVGGMALGAIPIVSAITLLSAHNGEPLPGFYVRKEAKTHGTQNLIEGNFPKNSNAPVAIIDDVVTGGGSILQAIDAVEAQGNPIAAVWCILDRREGGTDRLQERGYELQAMYTMIDGKPVLNP